MLRSGRHLATHRRCPSSPDNHTLPQVGATDKGRIHACSGASKAVLFSILAMKDFQKFSKRLRPFCRPFRQALAVGKQLCDCGFLGWQIEAARMIVHDVICVWFFPDHRRHSRHYSLHLARDGGGFFCGGLRVFCCCFHIYTRKRYWTFLLVGDVPTRSTCSSASWMMSCFI